MLVRIDHDGVGLSDCLPCRRVELRLGKVGDGRKESAVGGVDMDPPATRARKLHGLRERIDRTGGGSAQREHERADVIRIFQLLERPG